VKREFLTFAVPKAGFFRRRKRVLPNALAALSLEAINFNERFAFTDVWSREARSVAGLNSAVNGIRLKIVENGSDIFIVQSQHPRRIKRARAEIDRLRVIMLMRPDYDEGSK